MQADKLNKVIFSKSDGDIKLVKKVSNFYLTNILLGEGAYGKVVLSKTVNGLVCATKFLKSGQKESFIREAQSLFKARSKHVIKIYSCAPTSSDNYYLFLEYANRGSLKSYISKKGPLNEAEIKIIFSQICIGVKHFHDNGFIHRDLKTDNILLHDRSQSNKIEDYISVKKGLENFEINHNILVKIADLGQFKLFDMASTLCGSYGHVAPEVVQTNFKKSKYNFKADIWTLGIILYEMLFGELPFPINTILHPQNYTLPNKFIVSKELLTLLNGLIQGDPEKRFNWEQIDSHPFFTHPQEQHQMLDLSTLSESDLIISLENTLIWASDETISQNKKIEENWIWKEYNKMKPKIDEISSPQSPEPYSSGNNLEDSFINDFEVIEKVLEDENEFPNIVHLSKAKFEIQEDYLLG